MKRITKWRPRLRSKNHTCDSLRHHIENGLGFFPFKSLIRLGSTTPSKKAFPKSYNEIIEINSVEGINNSRSKLLMKDCFAEAEVPQSNWYRIITEHDLDEEYLFEDKNNKSLTINELSYPIVAKRIFGFKGYGMFLVETKEDLKEWLSKNKTDGYYLEEFKNFNREYRLHCTKWGCFYAARKMLKANVPEDKRWFRNDSNSVWIAEYTVEKDENGNIIKYNEDVPNEAFNKPVNWDKIEEDCVKALKACKLDIGAFDVRVQSAMNKGGNIRENPEYIIIEVNSAPSFGDITTMKYKQILPELLMDKYESK